MFGIIPSCCALQEDKEYRCEYTKHPCVARTFDGMDGEYDTLDQLMALCPLYSISKGHNTNSIKQIVKKRELPENLESAISLNDKVDLIVQPKK